MTTATKNSSSSDRAHVVGLLAGGRFRTYRCDWEALPQAWRAGELRSTRIDVVIRFEKKRNRKVDFMGYLALTLSLGAIIWANVPGIAYLVLWANCTLLACAFGAYIALIVGGRLSPHRGLGVHAILKSLTPAERAEYVIRRSGIPPLLGAVEPSTPPWEGPGATRRDWEPQRTRLLRWLALLPELCASAAIVFSLVGVAASAFAWPDSRRAVASVCLLAPNVLGLFLGRTIYTMAHREVIDMRTGRKDTGELRLAHSTLARGTIYRFHALVLCLVLLATAIYGLYGRWG